LVYLFISDVVEEVEFVYWCVETGLDGYYFFWFGEEPNAAINLEEFKTENWYIIGCSLLCCICYTLR